MKQQTLAAAADQGGGFEQYRRGAIDRTSSSQVPERWAGQRHQDIERVDRLSHEFPLHGFTPETNVIVSVMDHSVRMDVDESPHFYTTTRLRLET